MSRRLFNFTAAVSMLLCLATVGLWVLSYWRPIIRPLIGDDKGFYAETGNLQYSYRIDPPAIQVTLEWWGFYNLEIVEFGEFPHGLFTGSKAKPDVWHRVIGAPCWKIVLLTAILPALRSGMLIRHSFQSRTGFCSKCNYNLTGNTSGVCPECGMAILKA